jgi:hypothetical protein
MDIATKAYTNANLDDKKLIMKKHASYGEEMRLYTTDVDCSSIGTTMLHMHYPACSGLGSSDVCMAFAQVFHIVTCRTNIDDMPYCPFIYIAK